MFFLFLANNQTRPLHGYHKVEIIKTKEEKKQAGDRVDKRFLEIYTLFSRKFSHIFNNSISFAILSH